jgi:hypothetical protein
MHFCSPYEIGFILFIKIYIEDDVVSFNMKERCTIYLYHCRLE